MTIKICTCGNRITTKNINKVKPYTINYWPEIKTRFMWFHCALCGSTLVIKSEKEIKDDRQTG